MLPLLSTSRLHPDRLPAGRIGALYVHVPFCFHKCHYCDFYSITRQTPERMTRFVDLMLREAEMYRADRPENSNSLEFSFLKTVFFGGGTPSLLASPEMRRLIRGLRDRFDLSHVDEWTIECNPATVTRDYCSMLFDEGIARLSFGAQSFNPAELKMLERHHDPEDVPRGIEMARAAGFTRLNLDLIYAIPGQDLNSWMASLEAALALRTPHLSCYGLTYEPNTPMAVKKRLGQFRGTEEKIELEMFHATRRRLAEAGLNAYEISNYATSGEECRHNLVYWSGGNYIGLGPSAASHVEGMRWRNRPHLGEWESAVESGQLPATDVEVLSLPRRAGELAYLQLRLTTGIQLGEFQKRTGLHALRLFADPVERYAKSGLLTVDADSIRLTESGLAVADAIAAEFLAPADDVD
jgi:oxygen-independent coproporphyrinogen-3 oxidase